jgi:acetyltransferase
MTQIDYDREMALVALADAAPDGTPRDPLAIVRLIADPDRARAEFAIIVGPDMKGRGLGRALMTEIIEHARRSAIGEVYGVILGDNWAMIALARTLGFTIAADPHDASLVIARLRVPDAAGGAA